VSSNVVLPPRGEDVVDSAAGGRAVGRHCRCRTAGKEYHVVAAVEGHELKTPETEHRPGLERLLKTAHLELDGKLFVNMQQAPTSVERERGGNPTALVFVPRPGRVRLQ
jgi:hypothetical protein